MKLLLRVLFTVLLVFVFAMGLSGCKKAEQGKETGGYGETGGGETGGGETGGYGETGGGGGGETGGYGQ